MAEKAPRDRGSRSVHCRGAFFAGPHAIDGINDLNFLRVKRLDLLQLFLWTASEPKSMRIFRIRHNGWIFTVICFTGLRCAG